MRRKLAAVLLTNQRLIKNTKLMIKEKLCLNTTELKGGLVHPLEYPSSHVQFLVLTTLLTWDNPQVSSLRFLIMK